MNSSSTVNTPSAMELRIIFISAELRSFPDVMLNPASWLIMQIANRIPHKGACCNRSGP